MKSIYKNVVNDISVKKTLTGKELEKLQKCLINMLSEIVDACEKHSIKPFLIYGNLLGKIRHDGFIPWDDDIDIGLLREDYDRFVRIFESELSDKYVISTPNGEHKAYYRFIQVGRKGTTRVSNTNLLQYDSSDPRSHCYIDIMPFDYAPNNKLVRLIKGKWCEIKMAIAGCVDFNINDINPQIINVFNRTLSGRVELLIRRTLHRIFGYKTADAWYRDIDKSIRGSKSDYIVCALAKDYYLGAVYRICEILPLIKTDFYGVKIYLPNDPSTILKKCYGDYMKLPPVNERQCHSADLIKIEADIFT